MIIIILDQYDYSNQLKSDKLVSPLNVTLFAFFFNIIFYYFYNFDVVSTGIFYSWFYMLFYYFLIFINY
jgi:hypothetical protein